MFHSKKLIYTAFITNILCFQWLYGSSKIDVDLSGKIAVGFAYEYQGTASEKYDFRVYDAESVFIGRGEVKFTIDAGRYIKGRFELEGDYNLAGVRIGQCWIQFNMGEPARLRIGFNRKILGLEELRGARERITIHRSFVNRFIRSFGLLEYDPVVKLRIKKEVDRTQMIYYALSGVDGDGHVFGNAGVWLEWEKVTAGFSNLYTWYTVRKYRYLSNSNIGVLSLEYFVKQWYSSIEIFTGMDPNATKGNGAMGKPRKVIFCAAKMLMKQAILLKPDFLKHVAPLFSFSWLMNDTYNPEKGFCEFLGGINLHFTAKVPVRFMTNFSVLYAHNYAGVKWGRYNYNASGQFQILW